MLNTATVTVLFAAAEGGGGGQQGPPAGGFGLLVPMILILVVFFWFTHRSQKKKDQERQEMLDSIKMKDDVVTIGGIHGRVVSVDDETFDLRVNDYKDSRITINKSAVAHKAGEGESEGSE